MALGLRFMHQRPTQAAQLRAADHAALLVRCRARVPSCGTSPTVSRTRQPVRLHPPAHSAAQPTPAALPTHCLSATHCCAAPPPHPSWAVSFKLGKYKGRDELLEHLHMLLYRRKGTVRRATVCRGSGCEGGGSGGPRRCGWGPPPLFGSHLAAAAPPQQHAGSAAHMSSPRCSSTAARRTSWTSPALLLRRRSRCGAGCSLHACAAAGAVHGRGLRPALLLLAVGAQVKCGASHSINAACAVHIQPPHPHPHPHLAPPLTHMPPLATPRWRRKRR